MARNRLHLLSFVQTKALAGLDSEKAIWQAVKQEFAAESPDGGVTFCGMTCEQVRDTSTAMIKLCAEAFFQVERRRLELDTAEAMLRADMLVSLDKLPLDKPREVREIYELYRQVATQSGEPSLRQALEYLDDAGMDEDHTRLLLRVEALYPTPAVEAPDA